MYIRIVKPGGGVLNNTTFFFFLREVRVTNLIHLFHVLYSAL